MLMPSMRGSLAGLRTKPNGATTVGDCSGHGGRGHPAGRMQEHYRQTSTATRTGRASSRSKKNKKNVKQRKTIAKLIATGVRPVMVSKFLSALWKSLCRAAKIDIRMSAAHHQSANGQAERTIQTLGLAMTAGRLGNCHRRCVKRPQKEKCRNWFWGSIPTSNGFWRERSRGKWNSRPWDDEWTSSSDGACRFPTTMTRTGPPEPRTPTATPLVTRILVNTMTRTGLPEPRTPTRPHTIVVGRARCDASLDTNSRAGP